MRYFQPSTTDGEFIMRFTKFFSTDSAKAIKAEKFGYLNAINYMAPHSTGGAGNLCPHSSAGCRSLCLGMYSGQAAMVSDLENGTNAVRESRIAKSRWFMEDRAAFMSEMTDHVRAMARKAQRESKALVVRPNGSSDLSFEYIRTDDGQSLPIRFPMIQFVDYTKNLKRVLSPKRPPNYHLTFSLSETNRGEALAALAAGFNVAVVFGDGMPSKYLGHDVIDGTEHDLRHLDPSPVIVGLDPKGAKAKRDTTGFVVRRPYGD
jgi:predicted Zn-ribbon and HTH transcriptional regulator